MKRLFLIVSMFFCASIAHGQIAVKEVIFSNADPVGTACVAGKIYVNQLTGVNTERINGVCTPVTTGGTPGTVTSVSVVSANGQSGSVATATTTPAITLNNPTALVATTSVATPQITVGTVSTTTGLLRFANSASPHLTIIQAGNAVAARTYTWPTNFGAAGAALTDAAGNGTLSWVVPSAGITNAAGANVLTKSNGTNLVASRITDDGTTVAADSDLNFGNGGLLYDKTNKRLSLPLSELAGIAIGELGSLDVTDGVGIAIGVNESQGNQPVYLARGTGSTGEPQLVFRRSNGTVGSPTNLSASQGAGSFIVNGYDAGNPAVIASFNFEVDSTYSGSGAYPGVIAARVGNGLGSTAERLRIDSLNFTATADPSTGVINLNASVVSLGSPTLKLQTTTDTSGSPTISTPTGIVRVAAAASSVTVTSAGMTSGWGVTAIARTNDTTCSVKSVVPGSGSFVINMTAACTANTDIQITQFSPP